MQRVIDVFVRPGRASGASRLLDLVMCAAAFGFVLFILVRPAAGHGEAAWIRDHPEFGRCCGIDDCKPLEELGGTVVEPVPGEYLVTLPPHDGVVGHRNARNGAVRRFRENGPDLYWSQDNRDWACIYANTIKCFFRKPELG